MKEKYEWLNAKSRTFLSRGYIPEGQTAEERVLAITEAAEKILGVKGFAEKFEGYMSLGYYSLSSPEWANFGLKRGLPISCNGCFVPDRMDAILSKQAEVGMQSKFGAGTSAYFGALRPRGATISDGGNSSGPVHFMELFDKVSEVVSQSNVRRGSFAAYLPIDHDDILEFLRIKSDGHAIQNMSFGICVTDSWMQGMIDGDKEKRQVWAKVLQKRAETGYPYIFFTDTVNNNAPQAYKDKGMKVHASNLCLTGDTLIDIETNGEKKQIRIQDLDFHLKLGDVCVRSFDTKKGQEVFSKISGFAQTGESDELMEITDSMGNIIRCTPEHQIYTKNRGYVQAGELKETDILISHV